MFSYLIVWSECLPVVLKIITFIDIDVLFSNLHFATSYVPRSRRNGRLKIVLGILIPFLTSI